MIGFVKVDFKEKEILLGGLSMLNGLQHTNYCIKDIPNFYESLLLTFYLTLEVTSEIISNGFSIYLIGHIEVSNQPPIV